MTVSDEGSDFEFNENDSGSDFVDSGDESDFAPEPPAKKTKTNGATGKARKDPESKQAKAPATPRTRKTPSKKGNAGQSNTLDAFLKDTSKSTSANGKKDSDDEMDDSDAKPEPQKPKETKSASRSEGDYEQRTIEEIYKKKTQLEHILLRPDTYIGSTEAEEQELWVFDSEEEIIKKKKIRYVPGLYKIVDEILVNAADNKIRDPSMNTIKVIIDRAQNFISIYNNGRGIPVTIHKDEGVYVPELIFGHLLTSSNYDDNEKKVTGGRNGYGAKLCNIFSTEFIVETADKERELKYRQVFKNNMSSKSDPKVTSNSKGEEFTRISFKPDLAKFNMTELDEDFEALIKKRVYDLAGCVEGVNVYLNGTKIPIKGFQKYVDMYTKSMPIRNAEGKKPIIHDIQGKTERWQVSFAVSDGQFQQVSFVNSICTAKGGTHVNHVTDQIVKAVISQVQKQSKNQNIRPFQIKNHMCVFINCLIENPAFDSQTKENMTLRQSAFGSSYKMSEAFSKAVAKSGIIDSIVNWIKVKEDQQMTKADSGKISRRLNIPKLDDANLAGRKPHNKKCTLILTEGDSAKNLVLSGLSVVGRDYYGVFPLRGKMLNVRDAPNTQIMNNQEITNIKQILGLKHGQTYNSVDDLRYGKLMIMTDQDQDGSHIKGLIINFIDHMFPSLLDIPGFLLEFITPIIRCTHKRTKAEKAFFTIPEYVQWASQHNDHHKEWTVKYFKGLGTSDKKDARKYFGDLATHMKEFQTADSRDRELINMAFNKKKVAARKEWLLDYSAETFIDHSVDKIKIEDFVNRELMLFSMGDNIRSIPSMVDGLKPGQRKVLYGSIKRPRNTEIKVAQLANYVAGVTQYHHGEASVAATIIGMAQDFVGSNNINLLEPAGQFGSRHEGGKAAASPRYLFTRLTSIARVLFHPDDDNILDYQIEEGKVIEPKWYMPVLPMVLVNGADGIGTGYSTNIPNYNPKDIIDNLLRMMDGQDPVPMKPWFRGFKGEIIPSAPGRYTVNGIAEVTDEQDVKVTELPVRLWTESFTEHLNTLREPKDKKPEFTITDYRNNSTDSEVEFTIHLEESSLNKAQDMGLLKAFKITSTIATTNLVCFDKDGKLKKYETPEDILRDFYPLRLEYYEKRKAHLVSVLKYEYSRLDNRARFVDLVVSGQLKYVNRPKKEIIKDLEEFKLEKIYPMKKKSVLITEDDEGEENNNSKPQESNAEEGTGYEYLFSMSVISFSREMIEDLNKQKTNKLHELNTIETTTAKDFWKRDLEAVLKKWEEILKADEEFAKHAKPLQPSKATKRKRTVKKPKKEKVVENMDVDED